MVESVRLAFPMNPVRQDPRWSSEQPALCVEENSERADGKDAIPQRRVPDERVRVSAPVQMRISSKDLGPRSSISGATRLAIAANRHEDLSRGGGTYEVLEGFQDGADNGRHGRAFPIKWPTGSVRMPFHVLGPREAQCVVAPPEV
jgi:hypothetical protein